MKSKSKKKKSTGNAVKGRVAHRQSFMLTDNHTGIMAKAVCGCGCGKPLFQIKEGGTPPRWASHACRTRAWRRRVALVTKKAAELKTGKRLVKMAKRIPGIEAIKLGRHEGGNGKWQKVTHGAK